MKQAGFRAECPFEIGDRIRLNGKVKTITDIECSYFLKSGLVLFHYQLDDQGPYRLLDFMTNNKVKIE